MKRVSQDTPSHTRIFMLIEELTIRWKYLLSISYGFFFFRSSLRIVSTPILSRYPSQPVVRVLFLRAQLRLHQCRTPRRPRLGCTDRGPRDDEPHVCGRVCVLTLVMRCDRLVRLRGVLDRKVVLLKEEASSVYLLCYYHPRLSVPGPGMQSPAGGVVPQW